MDAAQLDESHGTCHAEPRMPSADKPLRDLWSRIRGLGRVVLHPFVLSLSKHTTNARR